MWIFAPICMSYLNASAQWWVHKSAWAFRSQDGYHLPWGCPDTGGYVVVVAAELAVAVVVASTVVVQLSIVVAHVVVAVVADGDYGCCCGDYFGVFPSWIDGFHLLPLKKVNIW